jgi:hypothetical protein
MVSKSYIARETPIVWSDTTGDLAMTLNELAVGAVRVGAQKDFGAGSTPMEFSWRLTVQFADAPDVGDAVYIYLSTSDGSEEDGQVGVVDALSDVNSLSNCRQIGVLAVTSTDADHDMTVSGTCPIDTRYVCPVIYNATDVTLGDSNDVSEFTLTPIPYESQ